MNDQSLNESPAGEKSYRDIDGLVQERRNSSALAMELRLSCTNQSTWLQGRVPGE